MIPSRRFLSYESTADTPFLCVHRLSTIEPEQRSRQHWQLMEACHQQAEDFQDAINAGSNLEEFSRAHDSLARACAVSSAVIGIVSQVLERPHHKSLIQLLGSHVLECGSLRDRTDFFSLFGLSLSGSSTRRFFFFLHSCLFCIPCATLCASPFMLSASAFSQGQESGFRDDAC